MNRYRWRSILPGLIALAFVYVGPAPGQQDGSQEQVRGNKAGITRDSETDENDGMVMHVHPPDSPPPQMHPEVGIDEHLGETIPLKTVFTDSNGNKVLLEDFVDRPTILLPVFFHCPQACNIMLGSLAAALGRLPMSPGKDYRVIAFSFDEEEGPEIAQRSKSNYLSILPRDFPEKEWIFITGSKTAIDSLTAAIGYRFARKGPHNFVHPNGLVVLSADGRAIRYMYGLDFLPFDLGMALTEAAEGTPRMAVRKVLSYCFSYDPQKKTYVFTAFRILGSVLLLTLAVFVWFLLRKKDKPALPTNEEKTS